MLIVTGLYIREIKLWNPLLYNKIKMCEIPVCKDDTFLTNSCHIEGLQRGLKNTMF